MRHKRRKVGSFANNHTHRKLVGLKGGRVIYTVLPTGLKLPAGRHKITLANPELEISTTIVVVIKKGQTIKRFVDLKKEGVQH